MTSDSGRRVLLVDDAALVRLYYRQALEAGGFHVEEALNGLEAMEKVLLAPVDLLVVDINMPQMDGLTFLDSLRRLNEPVGCTPALVTSTESAPQDFDAARNAGANFYLTKPITRETLLEVVRLLCGVAA